MKIGFIGLGKMGSRMVVKLVKGGHEIVAWNRSEEPIRNLKSQISSQSVRALSRANLKSTQQNLKVSKTIQELVQNLGKPRVVWVMVTAGEATEQVLSEVSKYVQPNDIVIDGGNSFYKDTERRYQKLRNEGIKFLGIGVSGGIVAAEQGYPLMVGGDKTAYLGVQPLLESLAKPHGGHEYFGEGGAGHFVKMVHNAIEYGIMQSIGEGFGILEKSPYDLDLLKVASLYQKGTLVSGFMMERTKEVLKNDPGLTHIIGVIGKATGETIWAVEEAHQNNLPVEIIERSLQIRNQSETDPVIQKSFAARLVAALRAAFGGHAVKKK